MTVPSHSAALLIALLAFGGCNRRGGGWDFADAGGAPPDAGRQAVAAPAPGPSSFECDVGTRGGCGPGSACAFVHLSDGGVGSRCFPGACDPSAQDCPKGEKCTYVREELSLRRACVPEGPVGEGAPCHAMGTSDSCQRGLFCTRQAADGGMGFRCARFCSGSEACQAPQECNEVLRFGALPELGLICADPSPRCDLLEAGCPAPLGCYPTAAEPLCAPVGRLADGAFCEYANQCQSGSSCVGPGGEAKQCRRLCRFPSGAPDCEQGTCRALSNNPTVGACVP